MPSPFYGTAMKIQHFRFYLTWAQQNGKTACWPHVMCSMHSYTQLQADTHALKVIHKSTHRAWSRENKVDSLSVREKVRSSTASEESFQIEGIKHFLSTSCLLPPSPSPFIHSSFVPFTSNFTYKSSYFSPYCDNFPFTAPILMFWDSAVTQTKLTFTWQRTQPLQTYTLHTLSHTQCRD